MIKFDQNQIIKQARKQNCSIIHQAFYYMLNIYSRIHYYEKYIELIICMMRHCQRKDLLPRPPNNDIIQTWGKNMKT